MRVKKRSGDFEPVDLNKIVRAVSLHCDGLAHVDPMRVATKTVSGLFDGATTVQLDTLSIQTASELIAEEPEYGQLAARMLATVLHKEVSGPDNGAKRKYKFSKLFYDMYSQGLVNTRVLQMVRDNAAVLDKAIDNSRDELFEYFSLRALYDRYLLKHPTTRVRMETPQTAFMRVALGVSDNVDQALELYEMFSTFRYLPGSPTLFNSATLREQLSSCYLLDSPEDSLEGIYKNYTDIAKLSKWAGGIGVAYHRVRARGSLIKGTNGPSNGIVSFLKVMDSSIAAVNQCFAGDTFVITSKGPKKIKDIEPENLVLGNSGKFCRVSERMEYKQNHKMIRIRPKHSIDPIEVTDGHPFYAICGVRDMQTIKDTVSRLESGKYKKTWTEAKDLQKSDYLSQVIPTEVVAVEGFTEDDARLYGIMLGDGHCAQRNEDFGVTGLPGASHMMFVEKYLSDRNIHFSRAEQEGKAYQIRWSKSKNVMRDQLSGRFIGPSDEQLPFGREDMYDENKEKKIAQRFMHMPASHTWKLIEGLLETDGCLSRGREVTFTSTSNSLSYGLKYQLLRMGVPCAGIRKIRDLKHWFTRDGVNIRQMDCTVDAVELRIPAVKQIAEFMGCPEVTKFHWFEHEGMLWSRIRSVEEIEPCELVYDLKVDGDETYMLSCALVHNGGKRKGAACVYLESWHADIEDFLELRDNTGDEARRTHNLNLANWIPDIFMQRVEADAEWTLFDPAVVPTFPDLYGQEFESAYVNAEKDGKGSKTVKARDLYAKMMRTLAQTGNGWINFKDASNTKANQTGRTGKTIHLSNLCVAPETLILTKEGNITIASLVDQEVEVWNGKQYSKTTVRKTGTRVKLINVSIQLIHPSMSGRKFTQIDCTPEHKFILPGGTRVEASTLMPGTRLDSFMLPGDTQLTHAVVESVGYEQRVSDTYCFNEPLEHAGVFNGVLTGNCTEILEVNDADNISVCNLASINTSLCVRDGAFDFDHLAKTVGVAVRQLDRVIDRNFYPVPEAERSNNTWRPVGLGLMGLQDVFFKLRLPFDSVAARRLSAKISEHIYFYALKASNELSQTLGKHKNFDQTKAAKGVLQFHLWGVEPSSALPWNELTKSIMEHGLRNSLVIAIAPTATIGTLAGCYECIEPQVSNLFKRETLSGEFMQVNKYLTNELRKIGMWNQDTRNKIKLAEGSIQNIDGIPDDIKAIYRTAWELPMRSLIDMAADRGAFIDQSQSLNLYVESPNVGKLSSMYMYAFKKGLKTTYYLRSRPATKIAKVSSVNSVDTVSTPVIVTDAKAIACSLENPEACEACQ